MAGIRVGFLYKYALLGFETSRVLRFVHTRLLFPFRSKYEGIITEHSSPSIAQTRLCYACMKSWTTISIFMHNVSSSFSSSIAKSGMQKVVLTLSIRKKPQHTIDYFLAQAPCTRLEPCLATPSPWPLVSRLLRSSRGKQSALLCSPSHVLSSLYIYIYICTSLFCLVYSPCE